MKRIAFTLLVAGTAALVAPNLVADTAPEGGQQAPAAIAKPWTLPRTSDGKADLQGNWTNATLTPLERPDNTPLSLPKDQVEKREQAFRERVERLSEDSDPEPSRAAQGRRRLDRRSRQRRRLQQLLDRSRRQDRGGRRTVPFLAPHLSVEREGARDDRGGTAERRRRGWRGRKGMAQYDHPELRPLAERCLMSFGSNAGPPMLPNYFYNNNYQFVQSKDALMILVEMVHDVRTIRIGANLQHLPKQFRPWMGDSIGRWEGDTLVAETTNFHPLQVFRGASDNLKVVERFTRTGPNTIVYKFEIDDPTTFTEKWGGEVPFNRTDDLIYEYACHEGNYALSNVLSGERNREKREAEKKKSQQ